MSRLDILHAELEFFAGGGEGGVMPTLPQGALVARPPAAVSGQYGYQSVYVGLPVATPLQDMPALYLLMPRSRESRAPIGGRPGANMKFVEYTCELRLAWVAQGDPQTASVGSDAYLTFCGWLDAIGTLIRGGSPGVAAAKTLVTPSYPGGAVAEWGEVFSCDLTQTVLETSVQLMGTFRVEAMEQVVA